MSGTHALVATARRPHGLWIATCSCGHQSPGGSRTGAVTRHDSHAVGRVGCLAPEKNSYPSRVEAEQAMVGVWRSRRGGPVLRVYQCQCGGWHLTSKTDLDQEVAS